VLRRSRSKIIGLVCLALYGKCIMTMNAPPPSIPCAEQYTVRNVAPLTLSSPASSLLPRRHDASSVSSVAFPKPYDLDALRWPNPFAPPTLMLLTPQFRYSRLSSCLSYRLVHYSSVYSALLTHVQGVISSKPRYISRTVLLQHSLSMDFSKGPAPPSTNLSSKCQPERAV
jgi:hypothetical protein